jgi:hypothetical protein
MKKTAADDLERLSNKRHAKDSTCGDEKDTGDMQTCGEHVTVVAFELDTETENKIQFRMGGRLPDERDRDWLDVYELQHVDWDTGKDWRALSAALNTTIKNQIKGLYVKLLSGDRSLPEHFYNVTSLYFTDIFPRDALAFSGRAEQLGRDERSDSIYAVVLLYRNEYYGHIYSWSDSVTYAKGIRMVWDHSIRKDRLCNASSYLLEGVRCLCLYFENNKVAIESPTDAMKQILYKAGFAPDRTVKESRYPVSISTSHVFFSLDVRDKQLAHINFVNEVRRKKIRDAQEFVNALRAQCTAHDVIARIQDTNKRIQ